MILNVKPQATETEVVEVCVRKASPKSPRARCAAPNRVSVPVVYAGAREALCNERPSQGRFGLPAAEDCECARCARGGTSRASQGRAVSMRVLRWAGEHTHRCRLCAAGVVVRDMAV